MIRLSRARPSRVRILRRREAALPVRPVRREVISARPAVDNDRPPLLFVPGFGAGAWIYAEHWLDHAAERGFTAHAMSLRGHGGSGSAGRASMRAYVHDVVQVAVGLPRRAVLVGHGAGALVVAHALSRYPAAAGVLAAPVFGGRRHGWATLGRCLVRHPLGTLPAAVGGPLRLRRGQLFSRRLPADDAAAYQQRMGRAGGWAQWHVLWGGPPEPPVGDPPVLVLGSPDDAVVSTAALNRVARRYGGAPLLFPGMGHALMLDAAWREPIDAILDWLDKPA
jgi:pimeloyl-ACP methyl ester carboxylesterase